MTLRIASHIHSEWSYDGTWTLDELAHAFARRGYDALLMTEHDHGFDENRWRQYNEACAAATNGDMLVVPGIEYSDASDVVHVAVWGDLPFLGHGLPTAELLERARQLGGVTILTHPIRRDAWRLWDPLWSANLVGIEVWNRKWDGWAPSRTSLALLRSASSLLPFSGLDFHTARQFFPLAMTTDLDDPPTVDGIVSALCHGRCRSEIFGVPSARFAHGMSYAAARGVEYGRRKAARTVRYAERRLRGRSL
jgi:PHP domain